MDSDTLARIRAAIEADAATEAAMTPGDWEVDPRGPAGLGLGPAGGAVLVHSSDSGAVYYSHDQAARTDAAGIARARNRWGLYLRLARAAVAKRAFVPEIDYSNIREGLAIDEEYDAALAALAPEGAT